MSPNAFDISRRQARASGDLLDSLKAKRQAALDADRERAQRLIKLKPGIYFDPTTREILRKVGSQYVFLRHDRRRLKRADKLTPAQAETGKLRLIQGGLFWDPEEQVVYQFRSGNYILYSRDRRKGAGKSPTGKERRKGH